MLQTRQQHLQGYIPHVKRYQGSYDKMSESYMVSYYAWKFTSTDFELDLQHTRNRVKREILQITY